MSELTQDVAQFGRHVIVFKQAVDNLEDRVTSFNAAIDRLEVLVKKLVEALERTQK